MSSSLRAVTAHSSVLPSLVVVLTRYLVFRGWQSLLVAWCGSGFSTVKLALRISGFYLSVFILGEGQEELGWENFP